MYSKIAQIIELHEQIEVVDIGANPIDGDPPYKPLLDLGLCRVTGFEPQHSALARLNELKSEFERYLPNAVCDGGKHTLHLYRSVGLVSLLELDPESLEIFQHLKPIGELLGKEVVQTHRLDDLTDIKRIDLLKIDIQGSELSVFRHGKVKLSDAVAIQTEVSFVPIYKNQPVFGEVDLELRSQGFIPHCFAMPVNTGPIAPMVFENNPWKGRNQLGEADMVYVRDFRKPHLFTNSMLRRLALIAHHVYNSFDLAARCILILIQREQLPKNALDSYLNILRGTDVENDPVARIRLAMKLETDGDDIGAETEYRKIIMDHPKYFDAYNLLAHRLSRQGRYEDSEKVWAQCVQALPNEHAPRMYQSLAVISHGKLQEGFRLRDPCVTDARRTPITPPQNYSRWEGQDLRGKSIVMWTEFGFGDEIMFARFVSVFKRELGAKMVSIICQRPIVTILKSLQDADLVLADDEAKSCPDHDYWVFPHSIPVHYPMTINAIPNYTPYISAERSIKVKWQERLPKSKLKVGLVWKGNPTHENDAMRSIHDFSVIKPLFDIDHVSFISLQHGEAEQLFIQATNGNNRFAAVGSELTDFAETAAVVSLMDIMICVDTSVAHLAGALGVPTLLLLPTFQDWRWFNGLNPSPWYPSIQVLQQEKMGDWKPLILKITQILKTKLEE